MHLGIDQSLCLIFMLRLYCGFLIIIIRLILYIMCYSNVLYRMLYRTSRQARCAKCLELMLLHSQSKQTYMQ